MSNPALTENEISRHIVECAIEVHRALGGPGLLVVNFGERVVKDGLHRVVNSL
jgi:hypothetical protein